jgi:deazaflavin-dependent oxidoreductase (nitroreductase family)
MAKQVAERKPPTGAARWFLRAPIWMYRLGLGGLLGKKFILLNHTGRKSGLPRQAVLEVVIYDRETNIIYINAGFGTRSQWYQNLLAQPETSIQIGWRKMEIRARQLSPQEGGELFLKFIKTAPFAERYPKALGYEVDGTDEDYRAMGEMMIFLALEPR